MSQGSLEKSQDFTERKGIWVPILISCTLKNSTIQVSSLLILNEIKDTLNMKHH